MTEFQGRCLCGAIEFQGQGDIQRISACYCGQCRLQNGGGAFHGVELNGDLQIDKTSSLKWYDSSAKAERGFCQDCGTSLFWRSKTTPNTFDISLGTLNSPAITKIHAGIFVDCRADYQTLPKDVPLFNADGQQTSHCEDA